MNEKSNVVQWRTQKNLENKAKLWVVEGGKGSRGEKPKLIWNKLREENMHVSARVSVIQGLTGI